MALPGPDNVFVIGPATFVFELGMGLNYHCGLKVTTNIPFDLPYTPSNYVKFMMPQLQAIYDKHSLLRTLGLEEDIFGIVHRRGKNRFPAQPVGYDRCGRVVRSGEFGDEHHKDAQHIFLYGRETIELAEPVEQDYVGPVDPSNYHQHFNSQNAVPPPGLKPPPGLQLPTHGHGSVTAMSSAVDLHNRVESTHHSTGIRELGHSGQPDSLQHPERSLLVEVANNQMQENDHTPDSDAPNMVSNSTQLLNITEVTEVTEGEIVVLGSPEGPLATLASENPNWSRWTKSLLDFKAKEGILVPESKASFWDSPFSVSRMVQEERMGIVRRASHERQYLGDMTSNSYKRNELNLPDQVNCTLFWRNLPRDIEAAELIHVIDTGALFSVHVRPAAPPDHPAPAANVAFMKHTGATRLLEKAHNGELFLRGDRVFPSNLLWNRHGQVEHEDQTKSRVLRITGPRELMTWDFWSHYMDECTRYQVSHQQFTGARFDSENIVLEVGFARIDAQAESIYYAIRKELSFRGVFTVEYGRDPCEVEPYMLWE